MFTSNNNEGFSMKFENGYTISEVAILNRGKFIKAFEDKREIKGWVDSDEVATIIDIVSNASNADQIRVGINNMRPRKREMFPGPINL